jgi:hypothetical protein
MIATQMVDEVRRLLREGGLSQRRIAVKLGISRGTVNAIALGRRPDYPSHGRTDEPGFTPPMGLPVRCPTCGGKVQMPCLLCYVRRIKERGTTSACG